MECSNRASNKDIFRFKQFSVRQGNVAMRVNTDGVLLGAYTANYLESSLSKHSVEKTFKVLDIGTGTGIIALMIAQKLYSLFNSQNSNFKIDAIDIEEECYRIAAENFSNSPWGTHLNSFHTSIQDFSAQKLSSSSAICSEKYDLIVSNPPYFNNSLKNPSKEKSTARHTTELSYKDLITSSVQLLKDAGTLAVIVPITEKEKFLELAHQSFLYEKAERVVYSKHSDLEKDAAARIVVANKTGASANCIYSHAKRVILLISKGIQTERIAEEMYLEDGGGERSKAYQFLTKAYYL